MGRRPWIGWCPIVLFIHSDNPFRDLYRNHGTDIEAFIPVFENHRFSGIIKKKACCSSRKIIYFRRPVMAIVFIAGVPGGHNAFTPGRKEDGRFCVSASSSYEKTGNTGLIIVFDPLAGDGLGQEKFQFTRVWRAPSVPLLHMGRVVGGFQ